MITFILGDCHKLLADEIFGAGRESEKESGALIILPEQYSFEGESLLTLEYDAKSIQKIEVTTISKIAAELCKKSDNRPPLTSAAAEILMRRIIIENEDKLRFFKGKNSKFAFVSKLLNLDNEFINGGVSLLEIEELSKNNENGSLCDKLHDISLLLSKYREECLLHFHDTNEKIKKLCDNSESLEFFKSRDVYFHGYSGFKAPQQQLIKALIESGCRLTFSFLADNIEDEAFLIIKEVIDRIERTARNCGVECEIKYIKDSAGNPQKKFATALFSNREERVTDANVKIISSTNRYDEIAEIAAIIKNAVYSDGARFSDFLVIARDVSVYRNPISEVFKGSEVPFYIDRKSSLATSSPAAVCLFALRFCTFGGDVSDAVGFAKAALIKIDDDKFSAFLSYLEVFNIKARELKSPFVATKDIFIFEEIEAVRKVIVEPLIAFNEKLKNGDKTKAIWELLERVNYAENLKEYSKNKDSYSIRLLRRQYDELIGLLDEIYAATLDVSLTKREYFELFSRMLSSCEYGSVERMIDEVVVTNLSTIPRTLKKTVFIIGANEGVYPLIAKESSIFGSFERRLLGKSGIEVLDNALYNYRFDIYNIYSALKLSKEKLYITYPQLSLLGEELYLSSFITKVQAVAGDDIFLQKKDAQYYINSKSDLKEAIAKDAYRMSDGSFGEIFDNSTFDYQISNEALDGVIGKNLSVYPTTIERYAACPFSYFCRYILSAKTLDREELSPLYSGNIIHYCLEQLMRTFDEEQLISLTEFKINQFIDKTVSDYLKEQFSEYISTERRFLANLRRVKKSLFKVVNYIIDEYKESSFRVSELELSIGEGETKPYDIDIGDGYRLSLRGTVDRVDCLKSEKGDFLRVIDYKSGSKVFNLSDIKNGVNLQLFIYLFTLLKSGKYKGFIPAGALYQPSFANILSKVQKEDEDITIKKSLVKNGLFLDDEDSLVAMERKREGLYIDVTTKRSQKTQNSLATLEEMGKIERIIHEKVKEMGKGIISGEFSAKPLKTKSGLRCEYCEYKAACKRRDNEEVREFVEYDREEFYYGD